MKVGRKRPNLGGPPSQADLLTLSCYFQEPAVLDDESPRLMKMGSLFQGVISVASEPRQNHSIQNYHGYLAGTADLEPQYPTTEQCFRAPSRKNETGEWTAVLWRHPQGTAMSIMVRRLTLGVDTHPFKTSHHIHGLPLEVEEESRPKPIMSNKALEQLKNFQDDLDHAPTFGSPRAGNITINLICHAFKQLSERMRGWTECRYVNTHAYPNPGRWQCRSPPFSGCYGETLVILYPSLSP
ncbi:hypothetical protein B0T17DRAFT_291932 [Bombardia bombarda]|uniref:Uncharacterized protein n=1 Tax=Bombardia bombarda TaxID=252184 RepID=A0AA39WTS6_9PEZI|nr:hypothetical protein B0T17DRAFT_291932 [Bombardia bombarda]